MDDTFIQELRKALNHLYDPEILIHSPLCSLLGVTGSFDKAIHLQHILEGAIQNRKPSSSVSIYSRAAQVYKFLVYRYLQNFSLKEVADELKVSQTQLYRIQQAALLDLAGDIWHKYGLVEGWARASIEKEAGKEGEKGSQTPRSSAEVEDFSWLSLPSLDQAADFRSTVEDVLALLQPALDQGGITLDLQFPENLPQAAVHPVALRQIMLNLVNSLVHLDQRLSLQLKVEEQNDSITLQIEDAGSYEPLREGVSEHNPGLQVARKFTDLSGGVLVYQVEDGHLHIQVSLPALKGLPVLVVEDNPDHFELLLRFVRNTPYKLVYCSDSTQAVEQAVQSQARIVLIDVLMPKIDGWAVLQSLRSHPDTVHLPVILCSIIPMEELALSLSANAFLAKPFKQEELTALLDQWAKPSGTMPGRSTGQNR